MLIEPTIQGAEEVVRHAVLWLKLLVEVIGAVVIGMGLLAVIGSWVRSIRARSKDVFSETRLTLARYLALALELQLGADILSTAVSPSWDQIGKLAAIAVIRTALNYFLLRELHAESLASN
ncbi:MAG: DUF1622 domain-containing protein [Methylococcales bacterium]|nr:DUF1622 domain-containing protein [Methylococcales bacterium]